MNHEIYRVVSFEKVAPLTLRVQFDDGSSQVIDFRPVLKGELYGSLEDPLLFDQVRIDPEVHTLVWPNGRLRSRYSSQLIRVQFCTQGSRRKVAACKTEPRQEPAHSPPLEPPISKTKRPGIKN
jgi:hypothetical protein